MSKPSKKINTGSKKARVLSARLFAVQAVYQMGANDQSAPSVVAEFQNHRIGKKVDEDDMVLPDGVLFSNIVSGVAERRDNLEEILRAALAKQNRSPDLKLESLLYSILICGAYELLTQLDTDAPIIINDYLNVTHGFYDQGESKLVNGVLDTVSKAVRDM